MSSPPSHSSIKHSPYKDNNTRFIGHLTVRDLCRGHGVKVQFDLTPDPLWRDRIKIMKCPFIHTAYQEREREREGGREGENESWKGMVSSILVPTGGRGGGEVQREKGAGPRREGWVGENWIDEETD